MVTLRYGISFWNQLKVDFSFNCWNEKPISNVKCILNLSCYENRKIVNGGDSLQKKLEGFSPVCMKEHIEEEIHQYIHSELS